MLILFGGTFDPVHRAHVLCAKAACTELAASEAQLIPAALPPHRSAVAASEHRLRMLHLAVDSEPSLSVNAMEIDRAGDSQAPSYSWHTARAVRQRVGDDMPLCLLIGADHLQHLDSWHKSEAFPELVHLAVLPRPQTAQTVVVGDDSGLSPANAEWRGRQVESVKELHASPSGLFFVLKQTPALPTSATNIRLSLQQGRRPQELDPQVFAYIRRHGLYGWPQGAAATADDS